jgi:hypothetical protein
MGSICITKTVPIPVSKQQLDKHNYRDNLWEVPMEGSHIQSAYQNMSYVNIYSYMTDIDCASYTEITQVREINACSKG